MFGAGLANESPNIDEPWRQAAATAIDYARMRGKVAGCDRRANVADRAIGDKHPAHRLAKFRRIVEPRIYERQRLVGNRGGSGAFHAKLALVIGQMLRQGLQYGDPYRDAHFDLLADEATRAVGDDGIDFDAAVHRPRMHHERIGLSIC